MPAQVFVHTRTAALPGGVPISNVAVSLHETGGALLASDSTGVDGNVFLGVRAAGTYEIRVSPAVPTKAVAGYRQLISVIDSATPIVFDVLVDTTALAPSQDSRLCRCSGTFVDMNGRPASAVSIKFMEKRVPNLLYDGGTDRNVCVVPKPRTVLTDALGFASVDLIRGAVYLATVSMYDNVVWEVEAPDLASASLPDVLFAYPGRVEYRDRHGVLLLPVNNPSITLPAGSDVTLSCRVFSRAGVEYEGIGAVSFDTTDATKVSVRHAAESSVCIRGVALGTATVTVTASRAQSDDYGPAIYPQPPVLGFIAVTVTA